MTGLFSDRIEVKYLTYMDFSSPDDLAITQDETEIGVNKLYEKHNISTLPSLTFGGLKYVSDDGWLENGCAMIKLIDNTSIDVPILNESISHADISFNFKIEWNEDSPPEYAYLRFAHKLVIGIGPFLNKTITLAPKENTTETLNLTGYTSVSLCGVDFEISIVEPTKGDEIYVRIETGEPDDYCIIAESVTNESIVIRRKVIGLVTRIYIENLGDRTIDVHVLLSLEPGAIYPVITNIYLNLWNSNESREFTPNELREYLEKFGVNTSDCIFDKNGLLAYMDLTHADHWIPFGYSVNTYLVPRETLFTPFFQKDNIIVVHIKTQFTIAYIHQDLRKYFGETILIRWYIDDIVVEAGYSVPETQTSGTVEEAGHELMRYAFFLAVGVALMGVLIAVLRRYKLSQ